MEHLAFLTIAKLKIMKGVHPITTTLVQPKIPGIFTMNGVVKMVICLTKVRPNSGVAHTETSGAANGRNGDNAAVLHPTQLQYCHRVNI